MTSLLVSMRPVMVAWWMVEFRRVVHAAGGQARGARNLAGFSAYGVRPNVAPINRQVILAYG